MKIFIFISLFFSMHAMAKESTVTVMGECSRMVVPDRASVVFTASVLNKNSDEAVKQATENYDRLKASVQKLNLKNSNLLTSEYSVYEEKTWVNNKESSMGFRARIGLRIETSDIKRVGEAFAVANTQKIKEIGQLKMYLSQELTQSEYNSCLQDAVKDAFKKATKIAEAAQSKLGEVLEIRESVSGADSGPQLEMRDAKMAMAGNMEVDAGRSFVRVAVAAKYSLK